MLGRHPTRRWLVGLGGVALLAGGVSCGGSSRGDDDDDQAGQGGAVAQGGSSGGNAKGGSSAGGSSAGGSGGSSAGGTGGSSITNHYFAEIRMTGIDKVDLLFMIDNSLSMASKQELLAASIPLLVERLIAPACVDATGNPVGENATLDGVCDVGAPEFPPIKNLHVGIITSSLGDHGSNDVCSEAANAQNQATGSPPSFYNDLAQLLPSVRPALSLASWNDSGFLVWDPRAAAPDLHSNLTDHETNPAAFIADLRQQATAPGEAGCGYEGSLEAWYRFLVDPEPVTSLTNDGTSTLRGTVNGTVLAQRAAFLRPDSLVAIVMMSDENDCSIIDEERSLGWLVPFKGGVSTLNWHMPRASSACQSPNDPCCRPCSSPPAAGCADNAADSACSLGATLAIADDSMNLRCVRQKQRFGIDLLYPTSRYIEALTSKFITPRSGGPQVPNPLFAPGSNGTSGRDDPGLVVLGGIVGVPWQDLATRESLEDPRRLDYLSASELVDEKRWDVMLGEPSSGTPPLDTLMLESVDPRTGAGMAQGHPLLPGAMIGAPTSTSLTNPINGHELVATANRDDLQYACIFQLPEPLPCTGENAASCACNADEYEQNSPVCTGGGLDTDGVQLYGKAYPGLRELEVLKGIGEAGVVGSICAKNVTTESGDPAADRDYGYNPFARALLARMKSALATQCLPRPLTASPADPQQVPCGIVEVTAPAAGSCDCAAAGRVDAGADSQTALREYLRGLGTCGQGSTLPCEAYCLCAIPQLSGAALDACQAGESVAGATPGFCYIDPAQGFGSENAVAACPDSQKRLLRFTGDDVPAKESMTFVDCVP
jgi:hypothetical protein